MPSAIAATPLMSIVRGTVGSRDSCIDVRPRSTAANASGTLKISTHRQLSSLRAPPTNGPSAVPAAAMPYALPMADWRRSSGNAFVSAAMPTGKLSAAPTPCSTRKAMTMPADSDRPAASDVTPNRATPARSTRLRPRMSPRRPPGIMNAPTASM